MDQDASDYSFGEVESSEEDKAAEPKPEEGKDDSEAIPTEEDFFEMMMAGDGPARLGDNPK